MKQERITWAEGIDRSRDPRHIGKNSQYDALNVEVLERGTLSKRRGFGRWRETGNTFSGAVRGVALMYDSDENRYLFVLFDSGGGTNLWVEKDGGTPLIISNFFPTSGDRVRSAVFGDRIYFVNGVDRPRWYKEYDGASHIWGIAGVPSPARRTEDESDFDYFVSRALYVDCITSSSDLGIDPPGIWRYKQTIGYYGKQSDQQVEESNAGAASRMFHCQFNTAEALGTTLEGYIKKGIPIGIADFDDLILDVNEAGGQDYEDEIRWMRMYRQVKMFSDELYSPFEFLVEMKKGWPTSISDVYHRDSAVIAPTTRVQIPVSHHIENSNNRLFLGRVEKELFTQPGLPKDFRALSSYKPNFSYRMPITIQNTNSKTLTSAIVPLRFTDQTDAGQTATPPLGGGDWTGAYLNTSLNLAGASDGWYQMIFVDEDGITPLGFCRLGSVQVGGEDTVTFLVEIPEIAAGGSRTIYLYFEDSQLVGGGAPPSGEPGHWKSLAHFPLLSSDHLLLIDFENWDTGMAMTDTTQKRSLAYIEQGSAALGTGVAEIAKDITKRFFNLGSSANMGASPSLNVAGHVTPGLVDCVQIKFYPPADSADVLSFAFQVQLSSSSGHSGTVRLCDPTQPEDEISILVNFADGAGSTFDITAQAWDTDGTDYTTGAINVDNQESYYIVVVVTLSTLTLYVVQGDQNGHPAEGVSWDTSGFDLESESVSFSGPLQMYSSAEAFVATGGATTSENRFGEIHVLTREIDGLDELIHFWMWDTYFPNYGLATASDRESQTGEKHPDRFYFSKLNQPNSFEAIDFRDVGELGRPIQGIKGMRNRVFVFTENQVKALFGAGTEQALPLGSGDTRMWNLSQDLTGDIGGLGVLAPDSLITMEFAGRDGVGFLSRRGFYFFDGNGFTHISEKVDNLIYDEEMGVNSRRNLAAHFLKAKRQLLLGTLLFDDDPENPLGLLVANMKFVHDTSSMIWTNWSSVFAKYGVELDFSIDTGEFVYTNIADTDIHGTKQILKLEGNAAPNVYKDISHDVPLGTVVDALMKSKQFDVFDAELLKCDLHTSGEDGYSVELRVLKDSLSISINDVVKSGLTNGLYRFPIGTNAKLFLFQLYDNTAFSCVFERLDFYFNVHGERRLS